MELCFKALKFSAKRFISLETGSIEFLACIDITESVKYLVETKIQTKLDK